MIKKELKYATFCYDEKSKVFTIQTDPNKTYSGRQSISLDKTYAFAFMRFVIRISQKNWLKGKKVLDKHDDCMVSLEQLQIEDPNQMTFEEITNEEDMGV